jgi:hypothetical protein
MSGAGSAAWQQPHAGRHALASGIDEQEADASPAVSDAATNAAKAIDEKRSLEGVIGMASPRSGKSAPLPTGSDFLS